MKLLDRYIIRNFLYAVLMWGVVFMTLRGVADLFINLDEFAKQEQQGRGLREMLGIIFSYYGYQTLTYFTELGGVIIVAGAAFSLASMNRTNELTAMLASGVSMHRVVVPIVICSALLGGLIVLDQEFIIPLPSVTERLIRSRDDPNGDQRVVVRLMTDGSGSVWYSAKFMPADDLMTSPVVLLRDKEYRALARVSGEGARPAQLDGQSGWQFSKGVLSRLQVAGRPLEEPPKWGEIYSGLDPNRILEAAGQGPEGTNPNGNLAVLDVELPDQLAAMKVRADKFVPEPYRPNLPRRGTLVEPRFTFLAFDDANRVLCTFAAHSASWHWDSRGRGYWQLADGNEGGALFLPTDLTAEDLVLRRTDRWLDYMSTSELTRLAKLNRVTDLESAVLARHVRFVDPFNNLVMLLLGLPFILSRERNIKASAALCMLTVGAFYAFIYICRYMGLPPIWAAWLPILLFGPIAAVMLDTVKT